MKEVCTHCGYCQVKIFEQILGVFITLFLALLLGFFLHKLDVGQEKIQTSQEKINDRLDSIEERLESIENPKEYALILAENEGVDPNIFIRLITHESAWNPTARSPAGARGLGQIMPFNADGCGLTPDELWEWKKNLRCSIKIFAEAYDYWGSNKMALCEYNAGRNACRDKNAAKSFGETRRYIEKILGEA